MRWLLLLGLCACAGQDEDPEADCRAAGAECCADADCGAEQLCHFSYTCAEVGGVRTCSEPEGDQRCHDLCQDSGGACPSAVQSCQAVEHAQGGDVVDLVGACF